MAYTTRRHMSETTVEPRTYMAPGADARVARIARCASGCLTPASLDPIAGFLADLDTDARSASAGAGAQVRKAKRAAVSQAPVAKL